MENHLDLTALPPRSKRISRACANCRRRKTKCNGNQPCKSCSDAFLDCSYEESKYTSSVAYIRALEKKIGELENALRRKRGTARQSSAAGQVPKEEPLPNQEEDALPTMVARRGRDSSDDQEQSIRADGPSGFGGLDILRHIHKLCEQQATTLERAYKRPLTDLGDVTSTFNVEAPESDNPIPWSAFALLPSKKSVAYAAEIVVGVASCTIQFLDLPDLQNTAAQALQRAEHGNVLRHRKQISLLFATLALSQRFETQHQPADGETEDMDEDDVDVSLCGIHYFRASRALLDIADCQDLVSLQTLLCLAIFTQSSSMLSTSYSYICIAVAAALRMGLFTDHGKALSRAEEAKSRKVARLLFILDTYITTALGLPRTLRDIEMDRIIADVRLPDSSHAIVDATRSHAQLIYILALTVESHHAVGKRIPHRNGLYTVEYRKIVEAENRLATWFQELNGHVDDQRVLDDQIYLRSQLMLRLYYAHVQVILYRPFLHHALRVPQNEDRVSLKAFACGSACIRAAMQVVWLVEKLETSKTFNAAHWFFNLIISNTAACLVLFATGAQDIPTRHEAENAIQQLKGICTRHARHESAIRQCLVFLESYFPEDPATDLEGSTQLRERFHSNVTHVSEALDALNEQASNEDSQNPPVPALGLSDFDSFVHRTTTL